MLTMSKSVMDVSGNNVPEISISSSAKEVLNVCHQLVIRKRNSFDGYLQDGGIGAVAYNRAISELEEELDRIIAKLDMPEELTKVFASTNS
jgi:hypothetical protein